MTKIEQIQNCIGKAEKLESKLTPLTFEIGGFTSPKIRHLLNNLGELATNYLEIGSHRGACFIASIYKNDNIKTAWTVDNFSEFEDGTVKEELLNNFEKFKNNIPPVGFLEQDCFAIDLSLLPIIDMYAYDGAHDIESHKKALTYFYSILANEFIYLLDDSDWDAVSEGTGLGLDECNLKVNDCYRLSGNDWHNGYTVYLLSKPKL